MTHIFDGKKYALAKEDALRQKVKNLKKNKVTPWLVSIIVGDNPASILYVNLKKKAAERVGCKLSVVSCQSSVGVSGVIKKISDLNKDSRVHGIMVQLPLPKNFSKEDRDEIIGTISREKDVDGMGEDSLFVTPAVKAIVEILRAASLYLPVNRKANVAVLGSEGFVGKKAMKILKDMGYKVEGVDLGTKNMAQKTISSDVLISATGVSNLIKKNMVKDGAVLIDVGAPKGDIGKNVYGKAVFVSPVPGGVGPVTIACLIENLIEASFSSE